MAKKRPTGKADSTKPSCVATTADQVKAQPIFWLWQNRIPYGAITILEADPDKGKSTITCDLAARLTTGKEMPLERCKKGKPSDVLFCVCEDDYGCVVRPRLEGAGADLSRVHLINSIQSGGVEHDLVIPTHLCHLRDYVSQHGIGLIVVDPVEAFLDGKVDMHNNQAVRSALKPLGQLASDLGIAIVIVRHYTKKVDSSAMHRGGGSIGVIGASRSALCCAYDPTDERNRILASVKTNYVDRMKIPSLRYRLVPVQVGGISTVHVQWLSECNYLAEDLMQQSTKGAKERTAEQFLRDFLKAGPKPVKDVEAAASSLGIAAATLRRARDRICKKPSKVGLVGGWEIELK